MDLIQCTEAGNEARYDANILLSYSVACFFVYMRSVNLLHLFRNTCTLCIIEKIYVLLRACRFSVFFKDFLLLRTKQ